MSHLPKTTETIYPRPFDTAGLPNPWRIIRLFEGKNCCVRTDRLPQIFLVTLGAVEILSGPNKGLTIRNGGMMAVPVGHTCTVKGLENSRIITCRLEAERAGRYPSCGIRNTARLFSWIDDAGIALFGKHIAGILVMLQLYMNDGILDSLLYEAAHNELIFLLGAQMAKPSAGNFGPTVRQGFRYYEDSRYFFG